MSYVRHTPSAGTRSHLNPWIFAVCGMVVSCATAVLTTLAYPGIAPGAVFAIALITGAILLIYNHLEPTRGGNIILISVATLLSFFLVLNINYFTVQAGGTDTAPVLHNPDACRAWLGALSPFDDTAWRDYFGNGYFHVILWLLFKITGPSISAALCLNFTLALGTVLLVHAITMRLCDDRRTATIAMGCLGVTGYFLSMGTVLLKDMWVIFFTALFAYGLLCRGWRWWTITILASVMLATVRLNMLALFIAGYAMMIFSRKVSRQNVIRGIAAISITIVLFAVGTALLNPPDFIEQSSGEHNFGQFNNEGQAAYFRIIGEYFRLPVYYKILMIPISAAVQFLIPLPWNFCAHIIYGPSTLLAHISYPWYAVGGVAIYALTQWRRMPRAMYVLLLFAAMLWLAPCLTAGGTVSRYALPAVPLMAPAAAWVLRNRLRSRSFIIYAAAFCTVLAAALITVHYLQSSI